MVAAVSTLACEQVKLKQELEFVVQQKEEVSVCVCVCVQCAAYLLKIHVYLPVIQIETDRASLITSITELTTAALVLSLRTLSSLLSLLLFSSFIFF